MRILLSELRSLIAEAYTKAYEILGVSPGASPADIKKAYLEKVQSLHPDKNGGKNTNAEMAQLNVAYGLLKDPNKKFSYDSVGDKTLGDYGSGGASRSSGQKSSSPRNPWDFRDDEVWKAAAREAAARRAAKNSGRPELGTKYVCNKPLRNFKDGDQFRIVSNSDWPNSVGIATVGASDEVYQITKRALELHFMTYEKYVKSRAQTPNPNQGWDGAPEVGAYFRCKVTFWNVKQGNMVKVVDVLTHPHRARVVRVDSRGNPMGLPGYPNSSPLTVLSDVWSRHFEPQPQAKTPDPKAAPPPGASDKKDTYKIYGKRPGGPAHTRFKGKVYVAGKDTKFRNGDRAEIRANGEKLNVKDPKNGHTQDWQAESVDRTLETELLDVL